MRYVFLTLLLLNASVFVWQSVLVEPARAVTGTRAASEDTIYLLAENAHRRSVSDVVGNPLTVDGRRQCRALGPFPDVFSGQQTGQRLMALDHAVTLRALDQPTGEHVYRVLIPPSPTLQEAFRTLRELKSQKIESYVVTEGRDARGISLGVFSIRASAEKVEADLRRRGYGVVIVPIPRQHREYWIYADGGLDLSIEGAMLRDLVERHDGVGLSMISCGR